MPTDQIKTPRTDAEAFSIIEPHGGLIESPSLKPYCKANFARSLERELAVAENALIKINKHKDDVLQRGMVANEALRRLAEMRGAARKGDNE